MHSIGGSCEPKTSTELVCEREEREQRARMRRVAHHDKEVDVALRVVVLADRDEREATPRAPAVIRGRHLHVPLPVRRRVCSRVEQQPVTEAHEGEASIEFARVKVCHGRVETRAPLHAASMRAVEEPARFQPLGRHRRARPSKLLPTSTRRDGSRAGRRVAPRAATGRPQPIVGGQRSLGGVAWHLVA